MAAFLLYMTQLQNPYSKWTNICANNFVAQSRANLSPLRCIFRHTRWQITCTRGLNDSGRWERRVDRLDIVSDVQRGIRYRGVLILISHLCRRLSTPFCVPYVTAVLVYLSDPTVLKHKLYHSGGWNVWKRRCNGEGCRCTPMEPYHLGISTPASQLFGRFIPLLLPFAVTALNLRQQLGMHSSKPFG